MSWYEDLKKLADEIREFEKEGTRDGDYYRTLDAKRKDYTQIFDDNLPF